MRKLIKDILKKRFDIDVLYYFDKFNDETEIIIGRNGLNNVVDLLLSLSISIVDVNRYGDCNVITVKNLDGSIWKK